MSNSGLSEKQLRSLAKEALLLSEQIGAMDRRIEQEIAPPKNALVEWLEDNALVEWVVDTGAEKALEKVFGGLLKATLGTAAIPVSVVVQLLHSAGQPGSRASYFDNRQELFLEYDIKSKRLTQIYREIFGSMPPSYESLRMDNICEKEACYRSGGALK